MSQSKLTMRDACATRSRGFGTLGLYLLSASLALVAVVLMPGVDAPSPARAAPADKVSADEAQAPPCRACEKKQGFFEDPSASDELNSARRLLFDLGKMDVWTTDESAHVAAAIEHPGAIYPGLDRLERRWISCLAIRLAGDRLADGSIDGAAIRSLLDELEAALGGADPWLQYQAVAALSSLTEEQSGIAGVQIDLAKESLGEVFDSRLLAQFKDRTNYGEG